MIKKDIMTLYGMIGSEDEKHIASGVVKGDKENPIQLAHQLADRLLKAQKYVILTRTNEENILLAKKLALMNIRSINCPSITISSNLTIEEAKKYVDFSVCTDKTAVGVDLQGAESLPQFDVGERCL